MYLLPEVEALKLAATLLSSTSCLDFPRELVLTCTLGTRAVLEGRVVGSFATEVLGGLQLVG